VAANFQKTFEFKVKRDDLNRAVDKLFKDLRKIELTEKEINKGVEILNKELRQSTREVKKAEKATSDWWKQIRRAESETKKLKGRLEGIVKGLNRASDGFRKLFSFGDNKGGFLRTIGELKALEVIFNRITKTSLAGFIAANWQAALAVGGVVTALKVGGRLFYDFGKAARQAEQSTIDFIKTAKSTNFRTAVQSLFPRGSILGGNQGGTDKEAARKVVAETKKLEVETKKVAKNLQVASTGLAKMRDQLRVAKTLHENILSSEIGYKQSQKEILGLEKKINQETRKRENILKRMTLGQRIGKGVKQGALSLLGGERGIWKGVGEGTSAVFALDGAIRKIAGAFNKQIGLYKTVNVSATVFWKTLKSIEGAVKASAQGLIRYEQGLAALIKSHPVLTQAIIGTATGLGVIAKYTPAIFNLGGAFRQLTADIAAAHQRTKDFGLSGLFSKGSLAGQGNILDSHDLDLAGEAISKELAQTSAVGAHPGRTWGGQTFDIDSIGGLRAKNAELERTRRNYENIDKFSKNWLTAVRQLGRAQTGYNKTLAEATFLQKALTLDIFAAENAVRGLKGALKGAVDLLKGGLGGLGNLLGGGAGKLGQEAGIIGISRTIELLVKGLNKVNIHSLDNVKTVAQWASRVTELVAGVGLAYGALSTTLAAAQWVTGAVKGFIEWESQAAAAIWRTQRVVKDFSNMVGAALMFAFNPFAQNGVWDLQEMAMGGKQRIENERYAKQGPTDEQNITHQLEKQVQWLNNRNVTATDYLEIQSKILQNERDLERQRNMRRARMVDAEDPLKKGMEGDTTMGIRQVYKEEVEAADEAIKKIDALRGKSVQNAIDANNLINKKDFDEQEKNRKQRIAREKARIEAVHAWERKKDKLLYAAKEAQERKLAARRKARADAMSRFSENLMLGAGFPLLFGGGAGAVGGGVLGAGMQSAMGSKGFGMQILFSALGQQFDAFAGKTAELGKAFNTLNPQVDTVISALGETNTEFGVHLEMLKKIKGEEAAMAEATGRLAEIIGNQGVEALSQFGDDSTALANEWQRAMTHMQTGLAELINQVGLFVALTDVIGRSNRFKTGKRLAREGKDDQLLLLYAQRASAVERFAGSGRFGKDAVSFKEHAQTLKEIDNAIDKRVLEIQTKQEAARGPLLGKGADKKVDLEAQTAHLERSLAMGTTQAEIEQKILNMQKDGIKMTEGAYRAELNKQEALQASLALYQQIGTTIRDGMVDAIYEAIDGTKTLGEVAASVFRQISKMLINYGVTAAFGPTGLNWLPGMAEGGPVTGGQSYLVGEKGPEIFTPKSGGSITPNHALGGNSNVTINVDAGGSSMSGDAEQAGQLGRMLAAAVQDEMARQKRPGGILY